MAHATRLGSHTVTITGAWPNYKFVFAGIAGRINRNGHIWLNMDSAGFTFDLTVQPAGFVFQNNGTSDGKAALFTSDAPGPTQFKPLGTFSAPTLDPTWTILTVGCANADGDFYYYKLNFKDAAGKTFSTKDPIIVNR
jgi:hypothetical protein